MLAAISTLFDVERYSFRERSVLWSRFMAPVEWRSQHINSDRQANQ